MSVLRKKKLVAVAAALALIGGSAVAYWTTSGSGTGSASTATSSPFTITQIGTTTGLAPGASATAVDFKITNPSSNAQYVSTVTIAITGVTGPNITLLTPCTAAIDFTLVQPTAINADVAPGDTNFQPSGGSIRMNNTVLNQDGCKGATVALSFTAA